MSSNKNKGKSGVVFSSENPASEGDNPFAKLAALKSQLPAAEEPADEPSQSLPNKEKKQNLVIAFERKGRGGKEATLLRGFAGNDTAAEDFTKQLKTKLGVGGAFKEGEIILQGDVRKKLAALLVQLGHSVKGDVPK